VTVNFTYLVAWDDTLDLKVGISTDPERWHSFLRRGARLVTLQEAIGTPDDGPAGLESFVLEYLRFGDPDLVGPAFHFREQAVRALGSRGAGYTECFHAWCLAFFRHALEACVRIMHSHSGWQCVTPMPAQMHGRTDARTYGEPHSPTPRKPVLSNARARTADECPDHPGEWADACRAHAIDARLGGSAVVRVGITPDGLAIEMFQPMCLEHEPVWFGPETFNLDTAKLNARVHNADRHGEDA
jgi:hypothetical protein